MLRLLRILSSFNTILLVYCFPYLHCHNTWHPIPWPIPRLGLFGLVSFLLYASFSFASSFCLILVASIPLPFPFASSCCLLLLLLPFASTFLPPSLCLFPCAFFQVPPQLASSFAIHLWHLFCPCPPFLLVTSCPPATSLLLWCAVCVVEQQFVPSVVVVRVHHCVYC